MIGEQTHAGTLTRSQDLKSGGDAYRQTMTWHLVKNDCLCVFQQSCGTMTNTIAAYKDLSNVEEWIKHYCQRNTGNCRQIL